MPGSAVTGTETLISTGAYDSAQGNPVVSGNYIGWIDYYRDLNTYNTEVYVLDLLTGQEMSVTNFSANSFTYTTAYALSINGSTVVWHDDRNFNMDIFLYPLPAGPEQQVTDDGADQVNATIGQDTIVWQDNRNGNWDIYSCTLPGCTPGSEIQVTSDAGDQTNPAIYGDRIAWQDNRNGNWDIYSCTPPDCTPGSEVPITNDAGDQTDPAVYGDTIVWEDTRNGNYDIYQYNLVSLTESRITTGTADQYDPAISGNYMVWRYERPGIPEIYIYDISGGEESLLSSSYPNAINPMIDGNRIVWEDGRNSAADIYLFTMGTPVQCPAADFTVTPHEGHAPFDAALTLPDPLEDPAIYKIWDLSDGTTTRPFSPPYTVPSPGIYDIVLTVGTPECRNATIPACSRKVFADTPPVVRFTATPKYGFAPLEVNFTDQSCGEPDSWLWDFGDGVTSTEQNPTHTYHDPGSEYSVRLDANNPHGGAVPNFSLVPDYIRTYLGKTGTAALPLPGIFSDFRFGTRFIDYNVSLVPDFAASPSLLLIRPPPLYGWDNITLYSSDSGFQSANGNITGNFSAVRFRTQDVTATNGTRSIGFSYEFNISYFPVPSSVSAEIWEGATPDDKDQITTFAFKIPPTGYTSISDIPFTAHVTRSGITVAGNATINVSVDRSWYDDHSESGTIALIGIGTLPGGDIVGMGVIPVRNRIGSMDYYTGEMPPYLTKFALARLHGTGNVGQIVVLWVAEHYYGPSSSDSDTGPVSAVGKSPAQEAAPEQVQPQPASPAGLPAETVVDLYINSLGVVTQATVLEASDKSAGISIGEGVTALDINGNPLPSVSIGTLLATDISGMPPAGTMTFAGMAYNFLPDGATFSPAVTVTFTVPEARPGEQYALRQHDEKTGAWIDLPTTYHPESGTITAPVSHFCCIALFSEAMESPPAAAPTTVINKPAPLPTPAPTNALGIFFNMIVLVVNTAIKNLYVVLIIVVIIAVLYFRGRRGKPDKIRYDMEKPA